MSRRIRLLLLAERACLILAGLGLIVGALGLADYALRLPQWLRMTHWALGVAASLAAAWVFLRPAWRLRPSPTALALRIERRRPELRGLLASGVEFARGGSATERSGVGAALAQRVSDRVRQAWRRNYIAGVLRLAEARRAFGALALVAAGLGALALASPSLTEIGARRALTPWVGVDWPKRTAVADLTDVDVHPLGVSLPLRAAVTRSNESMDQTDVAARFRLVRDGDRGPTRRALMTWQQRTVAVTDGGEPRSGELFERLVDADADAIEYRFETTDDATPWRRIQLVPPPRVLSAEARITPPEYASQAPSADQPGGMISTAGVVDLGDGTDERAVAPAALAESGVELQLTLNKPIEAQPNDRDWLADSLGQDAVEAGARLSVSSENPRRWTVRFDLGQSMRLPVTLVDEHGIASATEAVFRFEAMRDKPPSATVAEPEADRSALPTAVVDLVGEGRDDVGLDAVWLERRVAKPAGAPGSDPSGPGGALEATDEPTTLDRIDAEGATEASVSATLDLATLDLTPGDEVWIRAVASDIYAVGGRSHEPARSGRRRLRIITEAEFIEQIRSELSAAREAAIRLHQRQGELREPVAEQTAGEDVRRDQAEVSERIADQQERIERIKDRIERSELDDEQLEGMLDDAGSFLEQAGVWSSRASERLARAAEQREDQQEPQDQDEQDEREEDKSLDQEQARTIEDAQRRAQDELAGMIEMLDTGEDAWVMRRRLQELLQEQRDLRDDTRRAEAETAGEPVERLDPEQRDELERIVEQQTELARRAEESTEQLSERAEELEEHDPAAAAGMSEAARRARESGVSEQMDQAAEQAGENQMAGAGRSQQQAIENIQRMLEDMEQTQRAREQILRRTLSSLLESLEGLIRQQVGELELLDAALADEREQGFAGLDQGMIRLNRNTLGVLDQADQGGRELAPVADLIGRASDAQSSAIASLRAEPIEGESAREDERRSLDLLRQARDEARRLQQELQQRQRERQRRELRQQYRELLEKQVALRTDTEELAGVDEFNRRDRIASRRLGREQAEIRDRLREMVSETEELTDAAIFDFAHERLDETTSRAAESLRDASPAPAVPDQDTAVSLLQGLVEALDQAPSDQDQFGQGAGGGAGSGQGQQQPLIPPLAELRLLRQVQRDLARRTRRAAENGDAESAQRIERLGAEQRRLGELGQDLIERLQQQSQGNQPDPREQRQ